MSDAALREAREIARRQVPAAWVERVAVASATAAAGRAAMRAVPLALIDAIEPADAVARLTAHRRLDSPSGA